jgi:hypothetical protein
MMQKNGQTAEPDLSSGVNAHRATGQGAHWGFSATRARRAARRLLRFTVQPTASPLHIHLLRLLDGNYLIQLLPLVIPQLILCSTAIIHFQNGGKSFILNN